MAVGDTKDELYKWLERIDECLAGTRDPVKISQLKQKRHGISVRLWRLTHTRVTKPASQKPQAGLQKGP